jgi:molybdenum cofactor cytidylyltransferase
VVEVECVVPAAGRSRRMGGFKPLLPFRGSTIIETVVGNALEVCARVLLVTGHRAQEIERLFDAESRVVPVRNPEWETGMFSSIRCAVLRLDAARFFVTPGDMPFIEAAVYRALLASAAAEAVFPVFGGARGHPVLFSASVRNAVLLADPGTARMRDIADGLDCQEIEWADESILRDIDTKEQYDRWVP